MKADKTHRGFKIHEFEDANGVECSLQESSSAMEPLIWLGCNDANPMQLARNSDPDAVGWEPVPMPDEYMANTRMHLTIDMVKELIPVLKRFVKTGGV